MAWPWKFWVVSLFSILIFSVPSFAKPTAEFKKAQVQLGGKKIQVELAETRVQHEVGLMFREKLAPEEGMLFIFKNEETRFFWMKNTLIDLSIAYFDKSGTLVDIKEMKSGKNVPDSALPSYASAKPAKYALEMNAGWFKKNKIKIGDKITLP